MDNISMQAETLVNALPYIQKYRDKIIVVKYGGNAMLNEDLKKAVMNDIVLLSLVGVKVVLVHGGGPEINDMLKRVGKESKFKIYRRRDGRYSADGACWQSKQRPCQTPVGRGRKSSGLLRY